MNYFWRASQNCWMQGQLLPFISRHQLSFQNSPRKVQFFQMIFSPFFFFLARDLRRKFAQAKSNFCDIRQKEKNGGKKSFPSVDAIEICRWKEIVVSSRASERDFSSSSFIGQTEIFCCKVLENHRSILSLFETKEEKTRRIIFVLLPPSFNVSTFEQSSLPELEFAIAYLFFPLSRSFSYLLHWPTSNRLYFLLFTPSLFFFYAELSFPIFPIWHTVRARQF